MHRKACLIVAIPTFVSTSLHTFGNVTIGAMVVITTGSLWRVAHSELVCSKATLIVGCFAAHREDVSSRFSDLALQVRCRSIVDSKPGEVDLQSGGVRITSRFVLCVRILVRVFWRPRNSIVAVEIPLPAEIFWVVIIIQYVIIFEAYCTVRQWECVTVFQAGKICG